MKPITEMSDSEVFEYLRERGVREDEIEIICQDQEMFSYKCFEVRKSHIEEQLHELHREYETICDILGEEPGVAQRVAQKKSNAHISALSKGKFYSKHGKRMSEDAKNFLEFYLKLVILKEKGIIDVGLPSYEIIANHIGHSKGNFNRYKKIILCNYNNNFVQLLSSIELELRSIVAQELTLDDLIRIHGGIK